MFENIRSQVERVLGRDLNGEKVEDTIQELCDLIVDLRTQNVDLQLKNKNIITRVVRAKLELNEVIS